MLFLDYCGPGAGDGNRTHVASLEGWSSTIELHPRDRPRRSLHQHSILPLPASAGGGGRIRTYEDVRRQIYSLLPLTARQPLRIACRPAQRNAGDKMMT